MVSVCMWIILNDPGVKFCYTEFHCFKFLIEKYPTIFHLITVVFHNPCICILKIRNLGTIFLINKIHWLNLRLM